jgi:hypothetical protein
VAYAEFVSRKSGVGRNRIDGYVRRQATLNSALTAIEVRYVKGITVVIATMNRDDVVLDFDLERATQLRDVMDECIAAFGKATS